MTEVGTPGTAAGVAPVQSVALDPGPMALVATTEKV